MANWWEAGGATGCLAAYQPIGAASLAASYVNLANPGTYDAAPGVAPTFDALTGWTFNGSTQYLATGIAGNLAPLDRDWTILVRFSSVTNAGALMGIRAHSSGKFQIIPNAASGVSYWHWSQLADVAPAMTSGVLGIAGAQGYRDGAADGGAISGGNPNSSRAFTIGGAAAGPAESYIAAKIAAVAIWHTTLDAAEVAAVSAAMAALPTGGSWGGVVVPMPILMSGQVR